MNTLGVAVFLGLFVAGPIYIWRHRHVDEPFFTDEYQLAPDPYVLTEEELAGSLLITASGVEITLGGWPTDDVMGTLADIEALA